MQQNETFNATETSNTKGKSQQPKADGFINSMHVVDAKGNAHYINGYIPVIKDKDQLQRSLIAKAEATDDGTIEITIKARVSLAKLDDGSLLDF